MGRDAEAFDGEELRAALGLAVRAPSIHNSQPWRWRIGPRGVDLYTDATRRLSRTDPQGRDQVISGGAALHHLLVALAAAGRGPGSGVCPIRSAPTTSRRSCLPRRSTSTSTPGWLP